jgi:glycosyltransferase involved in cell wall biosynthesis
VAPCRTDPANGGAKLRMVHLMRELARRHEVTQFTLPEAERPRLRRRAEVETREPGYRHVRYEHPLAWAAGRVGGRSWHGAPVAAGAALRLARPGVLRELLDATDVTIVEYPWPFAWCRKAARGPMVLSTLNVETLKFESWAEAVAAAPRARRRWLCYIERAERAAVRAADLVLAVSDDDRRELIDRFEVPARRVVTVPNGADTRSRRPATWRNRAQARAGLGLADRPTAIYLGGRMPANIAGLEWVRRLAREAPDVEFLVIGAVAAPGRDGNLLATGEVADIAPYMHAADLSLCPIQHGGGTKLKLLDALSFGLPSLCFRQSMTGLDVEDGVHVLCVDDTDTGLLEGLRRLIGDAELASRMGRAGRALAEERYAWPKVAKPLEQALTELVAASPSVSWLRTS